MNIRKLLHWIFYTARWGDLYGAPKNEVTFLCRRKDKPYITFEAVIYKDRECWEIPKEYLVLYNLTNDESLDDDWLNYEWRPIPVDKQRTKND